jgi:hypothetical protein
MAFTYADPFDALFTFQRARGCKGDQATLKGA